jgi:site-specific recombinase XerD
MPWLEWKDLFRPLDSRPYPDFKDRLRHQCSGLHFMEFMRMRGGPLNADAIHDWLLERLASHTISSTWQCLRCLENLLHSKAVIQWKARHLRAIRNTLVAMQATLKGPAPVPPGPLGDSIDGFLRYKDSLRRGRRSEEALRRLDRYLQQHGVVALGDIHHQHLAAFLSRDNARTTHSCAIELRAVCHLFRWLRRTGRVHTTPEAALTASGRTNRYRPHIYTLKELAVLLGGVRQLGGRAGLTAGFTAFTALHLIYACGLRISEALRLRVEDVDLKARLLHIRFTKFGKSRQIPIGRRATEYLQAYAAERRRHFGDTVWFFVTPTGRAVQPLWLRDKFRRACLATGLSQAGHWWRIHDIRHSFAVHRLYKWYADGVDPRSKLMLLSFYMGHVLVEHTAHYLQMGQDLMRVASKHCARSLDEALAALEADGD